MHEKLELAGIISQVIPKTQKPSPFGAPDFTPLVARARLIPLSKHWPHEGIF